MAESILDMGGMRKKSANIVNQTTGQALYSVANDSGMCRETITDIYRCSPGGTREPRPYATFKGKSVYLLDSQTGAETKIKRDKFLYKKGIFRSRNCFMVDGKEYHIKAHSFKITTKLYLSDDTKGTPLAYLKVKNSSLTVGNRRMVIPASSPLLQAGKSTRLLDMAIIADIISRDNMEKNMKNARGIMSSAGRMS